jgi:hypothetical protein
MGEAEAQDLGAVEHEIQARLEAEAQLNDLRLRVDNAQQLANMGDYDWHIPTDTNRWSDQLYRIYGYEPQSCTPTTVSTSSRSTSTRTRPASRTR